MSPKTRVYVRFGAVYAVVAVLGLLSAAYILIHQRAPVPGRDVYNVDVEFAEADAVLPGTGQPVNVAGVKVGTIAKARPDDGVALLTLELERDQVPRVYENARAVLDPITPLKDMQLELVPGGPPARPLAKGGRLDVSRTNTPVPLSDLLSVLDGDTRSYLTSLLAALEQGTRGRAKDMQRMLLAMGPTARQADRINRAVARRREALARLVHNLGVVAQAASRDERLAEMVAAGNATLEAMARQERPLRQALREFPSTLDATRGALATARPFADKLGPTLASLQPAVDRLPRMLREFRPLADVGTSALQRSIRPFVKEAQPLMRALDPTIPNLSRAMPRLTRGLLALNYFTNVLAYNAPGDDEGGLFWFSWFVHNFNSLFASVDAHGGTGRATVIQDCDDIRSRRDVPQIYFDMFPLLEACPR